MGELQYVPDYFFAGCRRFLQELTALSEEIVQHITSCKTTTFFKYIYILNKLYNMLISEL